MPPLDATKRATLPRSAFAYVDSKGRKRLPIHDESHVRNAMARFTQTAFEDEAARELARKRILAAAKKYGIVPIGFFARQLREERRNAEARARAGTSTDLPTGQVTFLLTDIEDSTGLLERLGDRYIGVLNRARTVVRNAVHRHGGRVVDVRADEFFAVFERAAAALDPELDIQRRLPQQAWPEGAVVRLRIGIHTGRPTLTDAGYVGLSVNTTARVCAAGHGGQILVTAAARDSIDGAAPTGVAFRALGVFRLRGVPQAQSLHQVEAEGLAVAFPPPRNAAARNDDWHPVGHPTFRAATGQGSAPASTVRTPSSTAPSS